ncbi:MAG: reverse transcriptase domain-containing protein [Candidatus Thiodiazotropha endolucinida]|nr:hypothetical protein [Candidatus Thiodiazotropha taylori]MCW4260069.1 reverse transcriptase domain-containing protein [Candidatus Thiodiazotropha endolucinida]
MVETNIFDRLMESLLYVNNIANENAYLLMFGDYNARTSNYPDFVVDDSSRHVHVLPDNYTVDSNVPQRTSQDTVRPDSNGLLLLELCRQTGMRILNGRMGNDANVGNYTYVGSNGSSTIDYVLSSQDVFEFIQSFDVHGPNILTDHCCVSLVLQFPSNTFSEDTKDNFEYVKGKYMWNEVLLDDYKNTLNSDVVQSQLRCLNSKISSSADVNAIDSYLSDFNEILSDVCTPFFKTCNTSVNYTYNEKRENPWFNADCEEKRYIFQQNLNYFRTNKNAESQALMARARSEYKKTIRKARFEFDRQKTHRLEQAKFTNAKLYWKMLKDCADIKSSVNVPLNNFERYFKAINNPLDPFFAPDEDILFFNERYVNSELQEMFSELNLEISLSEIKKAVGQLKLGRSSGPDMFINEFLYYGNNALFNTLYNMFNNIFKIGYFPSSWSEGLVVPLHKKGSVNDINNYRGITLLSCVGKLFTRILNNRLYEWGENYNVFIEAQAGFRKEMSTVDNVFVLHGLISHMLNQGKKLFCAFVDFTKAFDYVVRDNLWFKLIKLGIRGKILNIIKSMYENVKSRVRFQNQLSEEFSCMLGVRQGECLSPFLFSMFLNDLEKEFILHGIEGIDIGLLKIFILLYADDIVIFSSSSDGLQSGLNYLESYCSRWKLKVNTSKTKVMVFRKGGMLPRNINFTFDNAVIDIVSKFTYLGVVFTSGGSFTEMQNTLAGQARKALFTLEKYVYKFTSLTVDHMTDLFDKLIMPILNYCSEVWGFIHANTIERVHLQFCKKLLGVKKSTQNDFIFGELGRTSLLVKRLYTIIKYWFKILNCSGSKYIRCIYNMMLTDLDDYPNKINWAYLVRDLLSRMGFYEVWLHQGVGNIELFLNLFRQRLTDNFTQNWQERLNNSSRANFYVTIADFKPNLYLDVVKVRKFRNALARFRVSSHRLEIEAGRWARPYKPVHERICKICNKLEDEFHFVIECTLYTCLRRKYIDSIYWNRPSMHKFVQLIQSNDPRIITNLAIYIYKAFEVRNTEMYTENNGRVMH